MPQELILLARTGSHAYGTDRPDSDNDYRGVFVVQTSDLLRTSPPADSFDRQEPDITLHELGKFCKLAAKANPTVMETLWCEPLYVNDIGRGLRAHRKLFVSKLAVKTYGGYAMAQMRKGQAGTGGSRGVRHLKREKFKLHTIRLLDAGIHLMRTGEVLVRHPDPDELWRLAELPWEKLEREFLARDEELKAAAAASDLPDEPDWAALDDLIISIRYALL